MEKVKEKFPFFTGATEDGAGYNCGGGVFFLDHDFYFYTGRDYLEIRNDFRAKASMSLLGETKAEA